MSQLASNPFSGGLHQGMGYQGKTASKDSSKGVPKAAPIQFQDIPSMLDWRKSCYGRWYTSTSHDKLLMEIERQIDQYPKIKAHYMQNRQVNTFALVRALGNIFDLTRRWIQQNQLLTSKTRPRSPAIEGLNLCAAKILRTLFGIQNPNEVAQIDQKLRGYLLKPMSDHGHEVDDNPLPFNTPLIYLNDEEAKSKQVYWRGGLAHQQQVMGRTPILQKMDTTDWLEQGWRNGAHTGKENNGKIGVAGFALSYDKVFYANKHEKGAGGWFFHSSYLRGRPVLCAGCMTIVDGQLTYINNGSGHYQPAPKQLYMALEVLRMLDVRLNDVVVDVIWRRNGRLFKKYSYKSFMKTYKGY